MRLERKIGVLALLAGILLALSTVTTTQAGAAPSAFAAKIQACEDYTPTDITVTPSGAVTAGTTLTVAGTGMPGSRIVVRLRPTVAVEPAAASTAPADAPSAAPALARPSTAPASQVRLLAAVQTVDVTAPAVEVGADGTWSTTITVPSDAAPGTYDVVAVVEGCETEAVTEVQVISADTSTTAAPSTAAPTSEPGASAGTDTGRSTPPSGKLARTGSSTRLPIVIGVALVAAGGLLLLRRQHRAEA